jgi:hypothetical protein
MWIANAPSTFRNVNYKEVLIQTELAGSSLLT